MITPFVIKLCLSFVVGGIWVALTTLLAERFGSKIGGLIGGLPSTALFALLFIGLTQSLEEAVAATTVMPLTQGFNGIFILVFILLVHRGLIISLLCSLGLWVVLASLLIVSGFQSFLCSVVLWLFILMVCYLVIEKWIVIPFKDKIIIRYSFSQILYRALFSGLVVTFAVLMSRFGGPALGGLFATFPAMFLSILVISYRSGGSEFSRAVAKSLLVSGMINVTFYVIAVRYFYATIGLFMGTAFAIIFSVLTGYFTFILICKKLS